MADIAYEILTCAVRRSFSTAVKVQLIGKHHFCFGTNAEITVVQLSALSKNFDRALFSRGKVICLGIPAQDIAPEILPFLGLKEDHNLPSLSGQDFCPSCEGIHHTTSAAHVRYVSHPLTAGLSHGMMKRPFTRFDFTDEWNNLGFGRITTDNTSWGVPRTLSFDGAKELASITLCGDEGDVYAGAYVSLFDTPQASVLWCPRPTGMVDSTEWTVVERFASDWRADELPCLPVMLQTPAGCRALVTMRLDCDEDISSARDLFEWYVAEDIPFSLAVKTSLPMTPEHLAMLRDVHASGGTLLSHSHTHPENWGASKDETQAEITASRQWFKDKLPEAPAPELAVSPFHTNPPYAMQGLEESGVAGVVSGIIHNDPEYMLGRAGCVPFTQGSPMSISQQSMLHGDSYREQKQSVDVHIQAFEAQHAARGIFGYLDHPFSKRYQYGWDTKQQRLEAHKKLVSAIREYEGVQFWSQAGCFEFIRQCSMVRLTTSQDMKVIAKYSGSARGHALQYQFKGDVFTI
jgi:hypothetical protein